jgi:hypothetical protein
MSFVAVLVGSLAYVGYRYYREKRVENLRAAMQAEIAAVAQGAIRYFHAPRALDGGSGSFMGYQGVARSGKKKRNTRLTAGKLLLDTENGAYSLVAVAPDSALIEGIGDLLGYDGVNPVKIRAIAKARQVRLVIVN